MSVAFRALKAELRRNARDQINRTLNDGAAAGAYQNALYLVEHYGPLIRSEALAEIKGWALKQRAKPWAGGSFASVTGEEGYDAALDELLARL